MMSIILIIALLVVYWLYSDARRQRLMQKNRSAGADFIDVEAIVVEETSNCDMCGGQVKDDFKVCPYCSYKLKPKCQSCGREVERSWRICPHCQSPTAK